MTWWLRTRRVPLLAAVVLAEMALVALVGGERIPVPSLAAAATVPIVAAVFLPLLVNSALQFGFEGRDWRAERSALRRVALFDVGLALALALALGAGGVLAHSLGAELALEGARNAVGYVGLGLLVAAAAGARAGSVAPAAYVVLVAAFGSGRTLATRPWNWPVHDADSVTAAGIALALLVGGAAASLRPVSRDTSA